MKHMTCLLLLLSIMLISAAPADAQNPLPQITKNSPLPKSDPAVTPLEKMPLRGKLPGDKKPVAPKEPTAEQVAEANGIFNDCTRSENQSQYFDCECMSLAYLELRMQEPETDGKRLSPFLIMEEVRKVCVNTTGIAGKTYNDCRTWAVGARSDAEEFCSCYANTYAQTYATVPTSNIKINERLMTNSLQKCGSASASQLRVQQEREIVKMQENGTYKQLFPGSEGVFYSKPKPAVSSAAKPKTPAQILSDHLNQSYTGQ